MPALPTAKDLPWPPRVVPKKDTGNVPHTVARDAALKAMVVSPSGACQTFCYARLRAADAFELVAALLHDPDPDIRLTFVTHVETAFQPSTRELLAEARRDDDARVRAQAAERLAWLGTTPA